MGQAGRPHILGIDDGPFEKSASREVAVVGVVMEGADLVEGVALTSCPVDGPDVTAFLADCVAGLRFRPAPQRIALGGPPLAGLAVLDMDPRYQRLRLPAPDVNRRHPSHH